MESFWKLSTGLSHRNVSPEELNVLLHIFKNLLLTAAKSCLKFVLRKTLSKKKEKGKSWYNLECTNMKKRLQTFARLLMKNPNNPFIRVRCWKVKMDYGRQ